MLHEPAAPVEQDHAAHCKTRDGVKMFILYAMVYGGFVAINLIQPELMERIVFLGMNLAVVYGLGLIVFALVLALVYNRLCVGHESRLNRKEDN